MSDPLSRICARCQVEKSLKEFPIRNAERRTYQSYCKPCSLDYGREHYRNNVAAYVSKARARSIIDRRRNREVVAAYLSTHPCIDCGEADPVVLEFDHRDPTKKVAEVSRLIHTSTPARVQAEIERCDVRCGNCHRIRTAGQFGSYRLHKESLA